MLETEKSWKYATDYVEKSKNKYKAMQSNFREQMVLSELQFALEIICINMSVRHPEAFEEIKKVLQK